MHGKAPEIGEGGITRTVVVDRQPATQCAQALQATDAVRRIVEDGAFRNLQRDPVRRAVVALQQCGKTVRQLRVHQVVCRDIDRYVDRQAFSSPSRTLRDDTLEHPLRHRTDIAGLLGERDELARRDEPAHRMLPAHEGFGVMFARALERHSRLVDEPQFFMFDGSTQIVHHHQALAAVLVVSVVP